jgi:hypothetical protein
MCYFRDLTTSSYS